MAIESHRHIVRIAKPGVGARREDDVHAGEQRRERPLIGQLLQVRHQNDLIDALAGQVVDDRLELAGKQGHVVALAAVAGETLDLDAAGGGNGL